ERLEGEADINRVAEANLAADDVFAAPVAGGAAQVRIDMGIPGAVAEVGDLVRRGGDCPGLPAAVDRVVGFADACRVEDTAKAARVDVHILAQVGVKSVLGVGCFDLVGRVQ